MSAKIFVIGIGPCRENYLTFEATEALKKSRVICGYKKYIERIKPFAKNKIIYQNSMGGEVERVKKAIEFAKNGLTTAIISSGDASLYGMASLALQLNNNIDIDIIPGLTAAFAASARIGAIISEDTVILSLSDILTPWELIKKRIDAINMGDFVCAIYNPKSKKRTTQLPYTLNEFFAKRGNLLCGCVKNCMCENEEIKISTIMDFDYEFVDMSTVVVVGNTKTYLKNNKLITPRGYKL
ncbi:precorrin-3B C(17)-methyltransferase [Hippea jasoniae]|uniref:precorrin-3B C(17)-methyltransferase n=1 Tax=Hippea jasoniae TaxID=944479 RepID=UPI00054D061F|nr:precorrin-3B C(17)-methyltransferase [Hippea jasoniae]